MTSLLPIALFIEQRSSNLGLNRTTLVRRLGYRNVAKGLHSLDAVCKGQLDRYPDLLRALPVALDVADRDVAEAASDTQAALQAAYDEKREEEDALYRRTFQPHAIILTKRSRPTQIFVVALLGTERPLRIDVDPSTPRDTWLPQAVAAIPERVLGFTKPVGIVMNYSPDEAVQYDLATKAATPLTAAKRIGRTHFSIGGRELEFIARGLTHEG